MEGDRRLYLCCHAHIWRGAGEEERCHSAQRVFTQLKARLMRMLSPNIELIPFLAFARVLGWVLVGALTQT